jgi:hypothetical protein
MSGRLLGDGNALAGCQQKSPSHSPLVVITVWKRRVGGLGSLGLPRSQIPKLLLGGLVIDLYTPIALIFWSESDEKL